MAVLSPRERDSQSAIVAHPLADHPVFPDRCQENGRPGPFRPLVAHGRDLGPILVYALKVSVARGRDLHLGRLPIERALPGPGNQPPTFLASEPQRHLRDTQACREPIIVEDTLHLGLVVPILRVEHLVECLLRLAHLAPQRFNLRSAECVRNCR